MMIVFCGITAHPQTTGTQSRQSTAATQTDTRTYPAHPSRMLGAPVIRPVPQAKDGSKAEPSGLDAAIKAALALPPENVSLAPFVGNFTAISASSGNGLILVRQADCSIAEASVPYTTNVNDPYQQPVSETFHYDQLLHTQAGLTTQGGSFASGCSEQRLGIASNSLLYAGRSTSGMRMAAVAAYSSTVQNNVLYTFVIKDNGTYTGSVQQTLPATSAPYGVAAADLNGDGNPDLVAVGYQQVPNTNTQNAAITILMGKADGTFTVGSTYAVGTGLTDSVVIDDFNGDGKPDVVVPAGGLVSKFGRPATLFFLPGNGDGTFGTAKTQTITAGVEGFASGDLNGDGKKDLVSGTGGVLLGNGDGTFQLQPTPAFPLLTTNSSATARVALADFNHDGKLDIAAGTGADIRLYMGNGDGTFAAGNVYAGIDNHGYLAATDLDGDGNMDLYSGNAQGGIFTGDNFSPDQGYALMGLGDGSFRGAPVVTAASFNAMEDLNGDGKLDFIGLSGNDILTSKPRFATYIGRGDGTFQPKSASLNPSFTYSGTPYTFFTVNSYVTADINSDGRPDILYLPGDYSSVSPRRTGLVYALANADGSFQTPVFSPAPSLDSGEEGSPQLSNLNSHINQSGRLEIVYAYSEVTYVPATSGVRYTSGYATQVSNGDGTFSAPAITVTYSGANGPPTPMPFDVLAFTDFNGDKIPDLIVFVQTVFGGGGVITSPSMLQIMIGKADGTFGAATSIPVVGSPVESSFTFGDLNGDGIPDIAIEGGTTSGSSTTPMIGIALGKGDGTFTVQTPMHAGSDFEALSIGDYTGDGKADLAMVSFSQIPLNGVFPGNGDGTFQTASGSSSGGAVTPPLKLELYNSAGAGTPAAGYDINGDGKLDLVAGGTVLLQASLPSATLAASATTLIASPTSLATGGTVAFTATVTGTGSATTPTGSVSFLDASTNLGTVKLDGSGKASLSTTSLAVGRHSIIASYSGDAAFAASSSSSASVTVTATAIAPSTTTLTASPTTSTIGQNVTFTAKVAAPSGNSNVPTGTVSFLAGSTTLGTGTLSGGVATFSTTGLPVGNTSVTASYSGDAGFSGSTSTAVAVTVVSSSGDFSLTLTPASATVAAGSTATTTVSVQPSGGFAQVVSFSCSGLPANAACSFAPATVTPSGSAAVSTQLTVATNVKAAMLLPLPQEKQTGVRIVAIAAIFGLFGLARHGRKRPGGIRLMTALAAACLLTAMTACGGGSGSNSTPTGPTTVTVTATGGGTTHTATFSLTVQ